MSERSMHIELSRAFFSPAYVTPRITDRALRFHRYRRVFVEAVSARVLRATSISSLSGFWLIPFDMLTARPASARGTNKHQWLHRMVGRVE